MSKNFLEGENLYFRPYHINDVALLYQWLNRLRPKPLTVEQVKDFVEKQIQSEHNVILMAVDRSRDKAIGLVGLYKIDYIPGKAEIRLVIGDKNYWKEGYGAEIIELITYFGFDRLNLNRIYLDYTADNKEAGMAYEKAGYIYEGTLREDVYRNGRYHDRIRMAILRKDYYEKFYQSHSRRFNKKYEKK